jgi:hypothetical protein
MEIKVNKDKKHRYFTCLLCPNKEFRIDKLCSHLKELKLKQEGPFTRLHSEKVKQISLIRSDDEILEILQEHL